jgi:hypothetical protein
MVAIPCLAQEIEPDGIFSFNRTLWLIVVAFGGGYQNYIGFYEGDVYSRNSGLLTDLCSMLEGGAFVDLLVVSFFKVTSSEALTDTAYGIMQPFRNRYGVNNY